MKKEYFLIVVFASFFGLILSSCATKVLTPRAVEYDIAGVEFLSSCQFYISKKVTLKHLSDIRQSGINNSSGVVEIQRVVRNSRIKIASSTPGILQTRNGDGDELPGYDIVKREDGREYIYVWILFEDDDNCAIRFQAWWDRENDRFQLWSDEVIYGDSYYTINYSGEDKPYLKYRFAERTIEQQESRNARGRRVGS